MEVEVNLDTLGWAKNCLSLVDYFTKLKHDYQAVRAPLNMTDQQRDAELRGRGLVMKRL